MPGLDPGIYAVTSQKVDAPMEWIAGSSPAMTRCRGWKATRGQPLSGFVCMLRKASAMSQESCWAWMPKVCIWVCT
jgi:hypothetical protein